jgi:hypothetical protein
VGSVSPLGLQTPTRHLEFVSQKIKSQSRFQVEGGRPVLVSVMELTWKKEQGSHHSLCTRLQRPGSVAREVRHGRAGDSSQEIGGGCLLFPCSGGHRGLWVGLRSHSR